MENQNYTPAPWVCEDILTNTYSTGDIKTADGLKTIARITAYEFYNVSIEEASANIQRIVDCVNACEGQPLDLVRFAKGHHDHCCKWEQMMMELVGEDSHMAVRHAIELLKSQRDAAFGELKEIREHIGADENESTYDEVVRLMKHKKKNWFQKIFS